MISKVGKRVCLRFKIKGIFYGIRVLFGQFTKVSYGLAFDISYVMLFFALSFFTKS